MTESFCRVGDMELCYETFGDPDDPALLLVMGLGTQMLGWHEELCGRIAERGFFVIRFDNRDAGRSIAGGGAPAGPDPVAARRPLEEGGRVHARGHGRRRLRAARPPRDRPRP